MSNKVFKNSLNRFLVHKNIGWKLLSSKRPMSFNNIQKNDVYSTKHLFDGNHGAVEKNPARINYAGTKLTIMLCLSVMAGAWISKTCTQFLEINQLYIYGSDEDLDDDDY